MALSPPPLVPALQSISFEPGEITPRGVIKPSKRHWHTLAKPIDGKWRPNASETKADLPIQVGERVQTPAERDATLLARVSLTVIKRGADCFRQAQPPARDHSQSGIG